jgi:hypothetical protein
LRKKHNEPKGRQNINNGGKEHKRVKPRRREKKGVNPVQKQEAQG